jgi:diguanylate cyclase (GGDEF)-like protein
MADIDFFKRVNDTAGHAAGDEVLRELGRFFTVHLRPYDVACRFGGEEFTLILPGSTLEAAARHAERLRESVRDLTPSFEGRPLGPVSLSLGVAAYPDDGDTAEALLAAADAALYIAKASGRNRVVAGRPSAG